MSEERAKRVGDNEALYRQVNERIKEMNDDFAVVTETFAVACECGDIECMERIDVAQDRYEQTRENATWFIVKPGHEQLDTERIVDRDERGGYVLVEKTPAEARQRAEESDPRA